MWIIILLIVLFIVTFISVLLVQIIRINRSCRSIKVSPVSDEAVMIPSYLQEWAEKHEFSFEGHYSTGVGSMSFTLYCWQKDSIYFCTYLNRRNIQETGSLASAYDFVRIFADDVALTTSSTVCHGQPCQPGIYKQSFSKINLDYLWEQHCQAESFLDKHGARRPFISKHFGEIFEQYVKNESNYIKTLWFWPVRVLFGELIGKYFWLNKTIEQQYNKGMIKLPDELS